MKPVWLLIEYESSSFLIPQGQDNVFFRDLGNINKNIVEIFVLDGPMRKQSWATIRANIEASRFRNEGIIVYPQKRKDDIVNIFKDVFEGTTMVPLNDDIAENKLIEQYYNKISNLVKVLPNDKPVFKVFRLNSDDETFQEEKNMNQENESSVLELLTDSQAFDDWFSSRDENEKAKIENTLLAVGILRDKAYTRIVNSVFQRMDKITDVLVEDHALKDVLKKIADGIASVLGREKVAVAIDAFDERVPNGGAFKGIYVLTGGDKTELKNMKHPFRLRGGSANRILDIARVKPIQQRAWFFDDVRNWDEMLPPLRFMIEKRDPDVESLVYLPLIVGQTRVGLAVVQFSTPHKFSNNEKRELNLLAKTAAGVLYGTLLKEGTLNRSGSPERLETGLRAIKYLTDAVSKNPDIGKLDILSLIYEECKTIFDPQDFYIVRYENEANMIHYEKAFKDGQPIPPRSQVAQSGLIEKILRDGVPSLITHNLQNYLDDHDDIEIPIFSKSPKSFVGVPIIEPRGNTYGALIMQDFDKEYAYSESDIDLLVSMANLASLAGQS